MSDQKETVWVNGMWVKATVTKGGKPIIKISVNAEKFAAFILANKNAKGYCNMAAFEKKNPDDNSTHVITLDTWQPSQKSESRPANAPTAKPITQSEDWPPKEDDGDKLPF